MGAPALGIIGVGHLASYLVAGLRRAGDERSIHLAPRNAQRARALAAEHGCRVAPDNQAVAERSEIVVLATRPPQATAALEALRLEPGQLVISVVAGLPLAELAPRAAPATVVRTLPVACAEVGAGPVPLYPDEARARAVLGQLGTVVATADEARFEQAAVIACVNGWVYPLLSELETWLAATGFEPGEARTLVLEAVAGACALGRARPGLDLAALGETIASPGTYTRVGLEVLRERRALEAWRDACEAVNRRLRA